MRETLQDGEHLGVAAPKSTLGFGSHSCIGAPLARMEMTEAFKILGERIERLERDDMPCAAV
jgi:cytochrome P450